MEKYSNGKIYRIDCLTSGDFYIGSTLSDLSKRLREHKYDLKCRSHTIIKNGNCTISLIENYPCLSRNELRKREGHYQRLYKDNESCLNCRIEDRTHDEWIQDNKEYFTEYMRKLYVMNKDKIKEQHIIRKESISQYQKEYKKNKKDKLSQYQKEYRNDKKDKLSQYQKEYLEKNREKINERANEKNKERRILKKKEKQDEDEKKGIFGLKLHCVCGSVIIKYEKEKHFLTKKHIDFMNALIK